MSRGSYKLTDGMLRLQRINRILGWVVVGLAVILAADFVLSTRPVPPDAPAGDNVQQDGVRMAGRSPFAQYASSLSRPFFHAKRRVDSARQPKGESLSLAGEAAHLELQGIFMDNDPQALVVDKRNGQSYRVRQGQTIGQIQVLEVLADGLILFYRGERLKLTL